MTDEHTKESLKCCNVSDFTLKVDNKKVFNIEKKAHSSINSVAEEIKSVENEEFKNQRDQEDDRILKSLSKTVKSLRRKIRNMTNKFTKHATTTINKYIASKLGYKKRSQPIFDLEKLCTCIKTLKEYKNFELEDQRYVLNNLIELIADGKMSLNSMNFLKIASQIRLSLDTEQSLSLSKKSVKFVFPERSINITQKEYEHYIKYKDNEEVIRTILGIEDLQSGPMISEKIEFLNRKEDTPGIIPMNSFN